MKAALVLSVALCVVALAAADDKYTTKYDNVDVVEIVNNDRLREHYIACLLADDDSGCTAEGKELRKHIADALENECSKCNDKQKENVKIVLKYLINKDQENWKKLKQKYDPEGKYSKKYEEKEKELHE